MLVCVSVPRNSSSKAITRCCASSCRRVELQAHENLMRQARQPQLEQVAHGSGTRQAIPPSQVLRNRSRGKFARGVQLEYRIGRVGARTLRAKKVSVVVPRLEKQREERSSLLEQRFGGLAPSEYDREQFNIACLSDFVSEQHFRLLGQ